MNETERHPVGLLEMTNEQYHSAPGISKSKLDAVSVSELNYWDKYINPDREPEERKGHFIVGEATHQMALELHLFKETFAVGFDKTKHTDALDTVADLKKALSELGEMVSGSKPELIERLQLADPSIPILAVLEAQHNNAIANKQILPAKDYQDILRILESIDRDPTAKSLISGAKVEQSFFVYDEVQVTDPETGEVIVVEVLKKCRTDIISSNGMIVADLKSTTDVSREGFGTAIARFRYHVQAAWYLDILHKLYGNDAPRYWAFIAAQKGRPNDVAVHYLTDEHIELGRRIYQKDLERLVLAQHKNYWPGVSRGQPFEALLPYWEYKRVNENY